MYNLVVCVCLSIVMSNILYYHMSLCSEFLVVMFVFILKYLFISYLCFFALCPTRIDYMSNMSGYLYVAGTVCPSRAPGLTPVMCFCALFVFVLCLVCTVLSVFLDCPRLIVPSVFSNIHKVYI